MSTKKLIFDLTTTAVPIFKGSRVRTFTHEFPVRRIYCVGRNYREHTVEMGGNPDREAPFFFMKPADAIVNCSTTSTTSVAYPTETSSLHYEGELIVAIGKDGLRIPTISAMEHVYGYSLGCDLTRRDLQSDLKSKRRPWDAAKGFDFSCPLSPIVPKEDVDLQQSTQLSLKVNGEIRQQTTIESMIYSVPEVICHLSRLFWLRKGDLIMTGTPAGVRDVVVGDHISISCGDLLPCDFVIGPLYCDEE